MIIPRVKICGNRNLDEALLACHHGADAVGLIVGTRYPSEDAVDPVEAGRIVRRLPPLVTPVLVTHLTDADEVEAAFRAGPFRAIQLHDRVESKVMHQIRQRCSTAWLMAAVHITGDDALDLAMQMQPHVDALVLDSRTADRIGGTGQVHDWRVSRRIVCAVRVPVFLAGGLTPDNVRSAVAQVRPFGVDVNSGVDDAQGAKCPSRVRAFLKQAKCGNAHD
jgi:phosphoribosylanthranilate isomerase